MHMQEKNRTTKNQIKEKNTKKEEQVDVKDLEENYYQVTPQERRNEMSRIRRINTKIQEIVNQKEGEEIE